MQIVSDMNNPDIKSINNCIAQRLKEIGIPINIKSEIIEDTNISVNSNNTKRVLGLSLKYIEQIGKLEELLIVTQYSEKHLILLLQERMITAKLANAIMNIIGIDLQVLIGSRELTELEEIKLCE